MNLSQTAILKWTFYALAAAALFFLRRLFLGFPSCRPSF